MKNKLFIIILNTLCLMACAPGLGNTLKIDAGSNMGRDESVKFFKNPVRVDLTSVVDQRETPFIGSINGRKLLPEGTIPVEIQNLWKNALKPRGVSISPNADMLISTEVRDWFIEVFTGFPLNRATAKALLKVEVFNKNNNQRYSATYSGEASSSTPILGQPSMEKLLAKAMNSAISAALEDGEFLAALEVL